MEFHAISELRLRAQGTGPAARQAFLRLCWFERGRMDQMRYARPVRGEAAKGAGRLAHEAYMDGYVHPRTPLAVHRSRQPLPVRAGSAEVRA